MKLLRFLRFLSPSEPNKPPEVTQTLPSRCVCAPLPQGVLCRFLAAPRAGDKTPAASVGQTPADSASGAEAWSAQARSAFDRHALALLFAAQDAGDAWPFQEGLLLTHAFVAGLNHPDAALLGLPSPAPITLELRANGVLGRDLRVDVRWLSQGKPVLNAQRTGCWFQAGGQDFRLSLAHFRLLEALERFHQSPGEDLSARLTAWSSVQAVLETSDATIQADAYLRQLRVYSASQLTLELEPGFNFRPTLLGAASERSRAESGADLAHTDLAQGAEAPDSEALDSDHLRDDGVHVHPTAQPLLPPDVDREFQLCLGRPAPVKPQYALGGSTYLVLAPPLRTALEEVKKAQRAPLRMRREFVRSPSTWIQAALDSRPEAPTEDACAELFVETDAFSERVLGLSIWQPKVLPWLKRPGQDWLPPVRLGGSLLELRREELLTLHAQLQGARAAGEAEVVFRGQVIPASDAMLACLDSLLEAAQATSQETSSETTAEVPPPNPSEDVLEPHEALLPVPIPGSPDPAAIERVVLSIEDNLEALTYAVPPRPSRPGECGLPRLRSSLKPHQTEGVAWLQQHWRAGSPGALLADDMGLGKTLQALAFLTWLREEQEAGFVARAPFLLIAPTGLLKNWEDEVRSHLLPNALGQLVRAYGGTVRALRSQGGAELSDGLPRLELSTLQEADWILTTYETMRDYQHSFARVRFSVVLMDEAQKIKSPTTLVTEAAKSLNAELVLLLTGTPVENRLADLWCLADAAQGGLWGNLKDFIQTYEGEGKEKSLLQLKHRLWQDGHHTPGAPALMLRRLKEDRLPGLPTKHVHVHSLPMPEVQARAYQRVLDSAQLGGGSQMLRVLQELRQVSLHPDLQTPREDEAFIAASARVCLLVRILDEIYKAGEKALVFVESLQALERLGLLIQSRFGLPRRPLVISGEVDGMKRKDRVDTFQQAPGFDVMLLTPRAGGVGLTLTAANHVLHLSRWWNPAVEDQCSDRVYRIGQSRPVHVYQLLALYPAAPEHSFDVKLNALLSEKRDLSRQLLIPGTLGKADETRLYTDVLRGRDAAVHASHP